MLKEQLNSCLPEDIKTYLVEKAPENLKKSAELADDYSLIHKHDRKTPQRFSYGNSSAVQNNKTGVSTNSNSSSTFCPHLGRVIRDLFRLLDVVYGIVRKH